VFVVLNNNTRKKFTYLKPIGKTIQESDTQCELMLWMQLNGTLTINSRRRKNHHLYDDCSNYIFIYLMEKIKSHKWYSWHISINWNWNWKLVQLESQVTSFFFGNRGKTRKKSKENYLEKRVPLSSASRRRVIPAGRIAMEAKGSRLWAPSLAK
jgi:hypothetical protein